MFFCGCSKIFQPDKLLKWLEVTTLLQQHTTTINYLKLLQIYKLLQSSGHWCVLYLIMFSHYINCKYLFRYFLAPDVDKAIDLVSSSHQNCESVKAIPKHFQPQSSEEAPWSIGASFATDVARRHQQLILILRETISSYTLTTIIKSEKHEDLYDALIVLCSQLRSLHDGGATVRVNNK